MTRARILGCFLFPVLFLDECLEDLEEPCHRQALSEDFKEHLQLTSIWKVCPFLLGTQNQEDIYLSCEGEMSLKTGIT